MQKCTSIYYNTYMCAQVLFVTLVLRRPSLCTKIRYFGTFFLQVEAGRGAHTWAAKGSPWTPNPMAVPSDELQKILDRRRRIMVGQLEAQVVSRRPCSAPTPRVALASLSCGQQGQRTRHVTSQPAYSTISGPFSAVFDPFLCFTIGNYVCVRCRRSGSRS